MSYSGTSLFPEGLVLFSLKGTTYEMLEDLGPGHHGERVLSALQRVKDKVVRRVILKALPLSDSSAAWKEARKRLEEEIQLATFLRHPNIACVHGAHRAKGTLFVITEAVSGFSLNTLLEVAAARGSYFPEAFMLYVGAKIAGALAHAHTCRSAKGDPLKIVHRAIDPTRIRVTFDGQVKLTDFGVASARLPGQRTTRRPGTRGEVFWASPEALLCQPEDARSDLFTLGIVLLEFATGKHLLSAYNLLTKDLWVLVPEGETEPLRSAVARMRNAWGGVDPEETILRAATFTPADVEAATQTLSEPTRAVFRKLLRRNPVERHMSALTLQDDLTKVLRARGSYTARMAAQEIQAALRGAGQAMAEDEEGPRSLRHQDFITTEPSPA
ncbi:MULTISPECIES: protein kinase domain-containing protein [unclassified Corallococcus]|uniref:protein kinase domain-containing protein n=1 Tax=unclassified Corallococcus TaxID=2685029 RepID=UPI001A8DA668|nr:protein kinase [Corallococcus sp. NCRR]MBN9685899.1 protein kinase [Corallococcus sp. NCSPR001]WAS82661.1 protein kinase [Corallococcus sp. NCRR]